MPGLSKEKNDAVAKAISDIEKTFGKGSIMMLGADASQEVEAIPTGSIGLDRALGIGGVPKGRIIEIYGPESSGKTTISLQIAAEAQKNGGQIAMIDAEHALDPTYARALGIDTDNLIVSQPDNGEMALEIAEALLKSGAIDVLIIDSVAALVPRAEIDGEMGDSHVGLQARLMSKAMRKLVGIIKKFNSTVIFINQLREKVGVQFGNPETTTGGRALKFYASVRLDVRRIDSIKVKDEVVGNRTRVKVMKNKVAPPFKQAEFDIMYGQGIDRVGEIIDIGVEEGVIEKSGSWFSYGEERLGQGRENAKTYLKENLELLEKVEKDLYEKMGIIKSEDKILAEKEDMFLEKNKEE
ncbi:MAG: recombinase RecA [Clostridium perfringens]|uniref:recombinase RecA n=1 Tax=Clostridium sp. TaxID=1506 RepID=UPI001FA9301B|nr:MULTISPECIES: recombinase RecA [Clostridium]MDU2057557.1 recombinase RecA [Clostridioides difficile]MDU6262475.1 recombinase RecA [Clostridium perfringens]MDY3361141.1 recombinase RecA [Clostridium celatum]MDB2104617.1 recombinase RecA [Clostridium paraputrificum]MDU1825345.1 recombinase RecA [Clostridium sp.]